MRAMVLNRKRAGCSCWQVSMRWQNWKRRWIVLFQNKVMHSGVDKISGCDRPRSDSHSLNIATLAGARTQLRAKRILILIMSDRDSDPQCCCAALAFQRAAANKRISNAAYNAYRCTREIRSIEMGTLCAKFHARI
jgi:hypothetical protein